MDFFRYFKRRRVRKMIQMIIFLTILGTVYWAAKNPHNRFFTWIGEKYQEYSQQTKPFIEKRHLNQAISHYHIKHGQYPPNLETLVEEDYIGSRQIRNQEGNLYSYSPESGEVE